MAGRHPRGSPTSWRQEGRQRAEPQRAGSTQPGAAAGGDDDAAERLAGLNRAYEQKFPGLRYV